MVSLTNTEARVGLDTSSFNLGVALAASDTNGSLLPKALPLVYQNAIW